MKEIIEALAVEFGVDTNGSKIKLKIQEILYLNLTCGHKVWPIPLVRSCHPGCRMLIRSEN